MAESNYSVSLVEGATAPSSATACTSVGDDCPSSVPFPDHSCFCEVCGVAFGSDSGLSLHQRAKHGEWYHQRRLPVFVRPGWSREEIVLVARAEIRLVWAARQSGMGEGRIRVNADLCRQFVNRKMDAIKYIRQTKAYKELLRKLEITMAEEGAEERELAPDGDTHLHQVMYGNWEQSQVVKHPRFVELPSKTVKQPVSVTETSESVPVGPVGEASGVVDGSKEGEDGVASPIRPQVVQRMWVTPEEKSRKGPKVRWGHELMIEVAREEQRLAGAFKMNVELHKRFPSRTLEAIKNMRRQDKYKALVKSLPAPHLVVTPPGPSEPQEGTPPQEVVSEENVGSSPQNVCTPLNVLCLSNEGIRPQIDCTMLPDDVSLNEVTMCEESFSIGGFGVDTPPRRIDGTDEGREKKKEDENDARDVSEPEPPSQACNPPQGDVSQAVGDVGGRTVDGQVGDSDQFDQGRDGGVGVETEYSSWKESLLEELVCAQGYLAGMDSLEFMDFRPGQLSREHREMLDIEYQRWVELELGSSHRRKGPRRRARRREAAGRKEAAGPAEAGGRRKRRRTEYARVQKLYRSNRGECSRKVLSGEWRSEETPSIPLEDQVVFWSRVFGEESVPDTRTGSPQGMVLWGLVEPITVEEIFSTLRKTKDGAVGLDKISRKEISKLNPRALQAHFNLWLYAGYQPIEFRRSRTVLIPKVQEPSGPGQFRPIAIGSFISRVFHRLLAERLSGLLEFQSRQRAFVKGDGIADNVFLLRCLLRDTCVDLKPMCLAFLDVSKAFDSVSHATLLLAAERMGAPGPFISYLRTLYSEASTVLHVDGRFSDSLKQNRGVRQGDPLSPLLFNCVIDWALASLDTEMGKVVGGGPRLNHLAFADDVVIIAESVVGLQHLCGQFERSLGRCGLTLNVEKSRTLRIAVDGKAKRWVCEPTPFVSLAGGLMPAVTITQAYKYLGVHISARERDATPEELLTRGLNQLKAAPLKPQQRMYMLRTHLLPKLHHKLVLSRSRGGVLNRLDRLVRKSVRSWLALPHDTTNVFIHCDSRHGGLGIPALRLTIPLMKSARLRRLAALRDPVFVALIASSRTFAEEVRRCGEPVKIGDSTVTSAPAGKEALAEQLYSSADGYGLRSSAGVPYVHSWVSDGTALMSGSAYIHAIQVRGATLATKKRAARGRPDANTACECCGRTETLGHVLQVCHRTWGSRIKRHDALMEKFLHSLEIRGGSILRAPVIPVVGGSPQKPDGVIYFQSHCWVVDASVVADNADLDNAHLSKCAKYDTPAVRDWCQLNWPSHEGVRGSIRFGALIFNWRGVMSRRSARMCDELKVPRATVKLFAVGVVEAGWRMFREFHRSTAQW